MELKAFLAAKRELVDQALETYLPRRETGTEIVDAMRYSLFAGGKRLRPILCLAGAEAVGGDPAKVMFCACAMEMIHTYSLIHDDLPGMDDDDLRRGVPTNHKVYGVGMAVLAGDGLLTQAFDLMSDPLAYKGVDPALVLKAANLLARASGFMGMVGGQAADLLAEQKEPDLALVQYIHATKTGAIIAASVESGALLAGGGPEEVKALGRYGRRIGLAFQIADDLLDLTGDTKTLGKTVGADEARGKMTYPVAAGPAAAREAGQRLVDEAAEIAGGFGEAARPLVDLAHYIMERTH